MCVVFPGVEMSTGPVPSPKSMVRLVIVEESVEDPVSAWTVNDWLPPTGLI